MSTTRTEPERLLTIGQAAELTNYDETTIRRWIDRGLPFVAAADGKKRPRAKDIRIRASDLWRWVDGLIIIRKPAEKIAGKDKPPKLAGAGGLSAWRRGRGVD
jgi:excisionase family DNA binding protein